MTTLSAVVCTEPSAGSTKTPELEITERLTPDHGRAAPDHRGTQGFPRSYGAQKDFSGATGHRGCSDRVPGHTGILEGVPDHAG